MSILEQGHGNESKGYILYYMYSSLRGRFFFLNKKGVYVYQPAMFLGLVLEGTHKTRNATSCFERVFSFCAVAVWLEEPPCCKEGQDIKYSWLNALLSTKKQDIVSFLT